MSRSKKDDGLFGVGVTPEQIEAIYQCYSRKVSKPEAIHAIGKALEKILKRRPPLADPVSWLMERTKLFAASPAGKAGKYCPHPATWFNGEKYDDDATEWYAGSKTTDQSRRETERSGQFPASLSLPVE